jgi:hypothetical protein
VPPAISAPTVCSPARGQLSHELAPLSDPQPNASGSRLGSQCDCDALAPAAGAASEVTPGYRCTHNTLGEAARIAVVEAASLLLALMTIPWRLLRGRKP